MSFGPKPWQQRNWDWRAAGNFVCGGTGAGLVVFAAPELAGPLRVPLLLAGLALVGIGLTCVWFEIGRPLRALNVFLNPRTSWMSREAYVAALLIPAGLGAAAGWAVLPWIAALLALVFVTCQGRMLQAARGIPAWRERLTPALIVVTGLTEGGGWALAATTLFDRPNPVLGWIFVALVIARAALWVAWRRRLARAAAPRALQAIDANGRLLLGAGSALPLLLGTLALSGTLGPLSSATMLALAAVFAAVVGARFKFNLLGAASFNQGFALPQVPVRGARY